MICRLCLIDLIKENAIHLFDSRGNITEAQLVKMIVKYLQLELTLDDAVSTCICQDCCEHLEDFHRFWLLVEQKQNTLRKNEFLEVKCDVSTTTTEAAITNRTQHFCENNEEPLLDLKNVLSEEYVTTAVSQVEVEIEKEAEFNTSKDVHREPIFSVFPNMAADNYSSDDDTPLLCLLDRRKTKSTTAPKENKVKLKTKARINKRANKVKCKTRTTLTKSAGPSEKCNDKTTRNKINMEIISDFMQLVCELCNVSSKNYTDFRKHFAEVHQRNAYVRCCNAVFNKPSKLVDHINWHRNPDLFKCDVCNKQLRSTKCLQVHKDGKHGIKEGILMHCHICNKGFRGNKCLKNHLQKHTTENEKSYTCAMCDKSFLTPQRLRRHIASIHENIFPHICDTCGKKFKFKPSFERHLQQHQGIVEPPEQCKECGEWMKNKNALRLHRFKHDSVNVLCHICRKICPSRTALRGHINYAHTLQKTLQCSYCEKSFKVLKNLQEHMAIHTGAQLYSCPHCAKECRSKSNMYVHIKRTHMQEWLKSKIARSNDPNFKTDATACDLDNEAHR